MRIRTENKVLKQWMEDQRWKPKALADAVGVSDGSVHAWMNWGCTPMPGTLDELTKLIKKTQPYDSFPSSRLFER